MTENRITVACERFRKYIPKYSRHSFNEALKEAPDDCLDKLMSVQMKKPIVVLLFSIFLGGLGVDRFYLGDKNMGIGKLALSIVCTFGTSILSLMVAGVEGLAVIVSLISLALGLWRTIWGFFDIFVLYSRAKEMNYSALNYVIADCIEKDKVKKYKSSVPKERASIFDTLKEEEQ